MREDHNFFCVKPSSKPKANKASKSTNAEEKRELKEEERDEELGVQRIFYYITHTRTLLKIAYWYKLKELSSNT